MQIVREIVLPTTREDAWDALTDADRLEEWFANDVELDLVPGGTGTFRWADGEEQHAIVEAVEPEERLVWRWEDDGQVELTLSDTEDGTRVTVRETSPTWSTALELNACAAWATLSI